MLPRRTANPYARPTSTAGAAIDLPLPPLVLPPPGVPVKMVSGPAVVEVAAGVVVVAVEVEL